MKNTVEHGTREMLLKMIRDRPGISFSRLMTLLGLNEGTLRYHLNYMERKELVSSRKVGSKRVYFVKGSISPGWNDGLTKDQNRVLSLIRRNPGIKSGELLATSSLTRKGLKNIISKLKEEHLVWELENGNGTCYEMITRDRLKEEMLLDLAEKFLRGEIDQTTFLNLKGWIDREENG